MVGLLWGCRSLLGGRIRFRSRSAPAGVEPAVSDGQPLLESKDELGIRSPVGVFAESSDGDRGARRREFRSAGLRVTGCTERDENAVEPHRRSTAALSGPEYRLGLRAAVEGAAGASPEHAIRLRLRHRRKVQLAKEGVRE